jgi:peroxiredoxin Q/BCP
MLKEGTKAPVFKLPGDDGKVHSLSDYKGKTVVLYFYPKDDTFGCTAEACDFRDNMKRIAKKDTVVIGVSKDSAKSHIKFKDKYDLNFLLLSDEDGKMLDKYGVWQEKSMYGRKYWGIVRTTFIIDGNGKIKKIFEKVKVKGHVDEVLENL